MTNRAQPTRSCRRRSAFSLVESVLCIAILGTAVTAGLNLYGSFARGEVINREMLVANQLAMDLLTEIQSRHFEDPILAEGSFGIGAGETVRGDYDDVDDYDGLIETPPKNPDGTDMDSMYSGYSRRVFVYNVVEDNLTTVASDGSTAVKNILVIVLNDNKIRAAAYGLRTRNSVND